MEAIEALWFVQDWLPRLFVLDVLLFHLVADHPLAMRWWVGRRSPGPLGHDPTTDLRVSR
jgi:hypothetical protein